MEREPLPDPTEAARKNLVEALHGLASNDREIYALKQFEKGVFMVPSETIKTLNALISRVEDLEDQKRLRDLYGNIIERGL